MTGRPGSNTGSEAVPRLPEDGISPFVEFSADKKDRRHDKLRPGFPFKPLIARSD